MDALTTHNPGLTARPFQRLIQRLVQRLASVRLGITIMLLLAMDVGAGYFFVAGNTVIFEPMNQAGLWPWIATYARGNLIQTGWFIIFLALVAALVVNTLCCTILRLARLWSQRHRRASRFGFSLATHIMHLGMVVILFGYLASYSLSQVYPARTLVPDKKVRVPGTGLTLALTNMELPYYQGTRLPATFQNRVIRPAVTMQVSRGSDQRILNLAFNRPGRFQGYTFFLQRFSPRSKGGMSNARYIVVDIRRDPGVPLYFAGIAIFIAGMLGYVWFWLQAGRRTR